MRRLRVITGIDILIAVSFVCLAGCRPDIDKMATKALKPAKLIKIGNHTFYPVYH